jgi:hypothetical protein
VLEGEPGSGPGRHCGGQLVGLHLHAERNGRVEAGHQLLQRQGAGPWQQPAVPGLLGQRRDIGWPGRDRVAQLDVGQAAGRDMTQIGRGAAGTL